MKVYSLPIVSALIFFTSTLFGQDTWNYTDQENGFTISYPKQWKKVSQGKKSAAKFVASKTEDGRVPACVILSIWNNDTAAPLDSVTFRFMKELRRNGNIISEGGESKINGVRYYFFSALIDNQLESILSRYYIALKDNKTFVVRLFANPADKFSIYESKFDLIIKSLNLH